VLGQTKEKRIDGTIRTAPPSSGVNISIVYGIRGIEGEGKEGREGRRKAKRWEREVEGRR
jgi:hypothetical protein